ncbi:hypothetical protein E1B28_003842 [Marasmius oreades]|uniref:Carboxylesterase type B domain-containing protein n=1 Tax=Marasmius oreades TaxID=181124 RepID=A0A9P7UXC7_9AGAR|nr:uncharacterized protein E1B28_003842 [Marasmius oreades]KAG7096399.1 hypothetical protein E1B28_003842 [Marasmius oreades]
MGISTSGNSDSYVSCITTCIYVYHRFPPLTFLLPSKMFGDALGGYAVAFSTFLLGKWNVSTTCPPARSVSLLFENDADWEHFGDHSSALFFHEPVTGAEAKTICKEHNETLFDVKNLAEISARFSYFQFMGEVDESEQYWAASSGRTCAIKPLQKRDFCVDIPSSDATLPFLCTNSAPHTTSVDTDFSDAPKVDVASKGTVFTGTRDHLAFRFMGIPYAQAPTGPLRFKYSQPWHGDRVDATALKPGCLQFGYFENNNLGVNPWGISEDCLYLNVYTPHIPSESRNEESPKLKPVLFWIHGGGNTYGLGSDLTFDGGPLASRTDTVVVTINYRLDVFGFLALNDDVITGNYALSDKITALQWVKDNIAAFGGDPNRVTISGQSAGGWSVIDLLRSPKAKGLFHRAISQSGGAGTFATPEQAAYMGGPLTSQFCNGTAVERLECLQGIPADNLIKASRKPLAFWPSVKDDVFIFDSPTHQISEGAGSINSVPFLIGFVPDEGQSALGAFPIDLNPDEKDFQLAISKVVGPDVAQKMHDSGLWKTNDEFTPYNATNNAFGNLILTCPAEEMITAAVKSEVFPSLYVYIMRRGYGLPFLNPFNLCTFPVGKPQPYYVCHSADLYPVFGTYHIYSHPVRVKEDIHYTALVQDMWGAFARSGNPNPDKEYLRARGPAYESTLKALEGGWTWPQFTGDGNQELVASLDYPGLTIDDGMPDGKNGRCAFLLQDGMRLF